MIEEQNTAASEQVQIKRALISVYDKSGVVPFARALRKLGVELISTGGTAKKLKEADLPVTDVEEVTGAPEMLDGRVKSLHPAIHAGILARRGDEADMEDLRDHDIEPIDLVVCNLYPFHKAAKEQADESLAVANIDIGGPTMLRAAAKNFFHCGVVSSPAQYETVQQELEESEGALSLKTRRRLAARTFSKTSAYDQAVARYFSNVEQDEESEDDSAKEALPETLRISLPKAKTLRYGENPHQAGSFYGDPDAYYEQLHGEKLSYNNLLDVSAALLLIDEFRDDDPTCAILKHTNPCGVASADSLESAYQRAFSTDRKSPYGGIIAVNRPLDRATAEEIDRIFSEVVIAPDFEEGVLNMLMQKKRRRVIRARNDARTDTRLDMRSVLGGLLVQERDPIVLPLRAQEPKWKTPTKREPKESEVTDLRFAWRIVKHVKSNAIVFAKDRATVGIGAGQMSRVDAAELAIRKGEQAELDFSGSVVASDAFFPFADGLEIAAKQGASAAIQPGGSIRDEEVVRAADDHDMAMMMTGRRHFRH